MEPRTAIHALMALGWSHRKLARAIGADQSTISRIADGKIADTLWSIGSKLINMAKLKQPPPLKRGQ